MAHSDSNHVVNVGNGNDNDNVPIINGRGPMALMTMVTMIKEQIK